MDYSNSELKEIARQLRFLAGEGHGGSEARLVKTLEEQSHRLQRIADLGGRRKPRPQLPRPPWISCLVLVKLVYDLLSYLLL